MQNEEEVSLTPEETALWNWVVERVAVMTPAERDYILGRCDSEEVGAG